MRLCLEYWKTLSTRLKFIMPIEALSQQHQQLTIAKEELTTEPKDEQSAYAMENADRSTCGNVRADVDFYAARLQDSIRHERVAFDNRMSIYL